MEDFKITSEIDLKTYYQISLRTYFKRRTFITMLIVFVVMQVSLLTSPIISWEDEMWTVGVFVGIYGIIPFLMYWACKNNMSKTAYLSETLQYTINEHKIALVGDSFDSSSNWKYISKFVEREKHFLIYTGARTFHYLPKGGFESKDAAVNFKNMVKGKGIKFSYT